MKRTFVFALFLFSFLMVGCGQTKVAITFDDGPVEKFHQRALPILSEQNVKVTFFFIGQKAQERPDLVREVFVSGHEIENHSYSHICLAKPNKKWNLCEEISPSDCLREVDLCSQTIFEITGYWPKFLRPPYFAMTKDRKSLIESKLKIKVIEHGADSIGSGDWNYKDPQLTIKKVKEELRKRKSKSLVIVFHENLLTLEILPELINFLKQGGYQLVRLGEIE